MRKTPALLMKELKAISKEIETILKDDKESSYAPLNNEMKIKYDNNYDYEANRKRIKELFDDERRIRLALNIFNSTEKANGTNYTISEALVRIAQLKNEISVLTVLSSKYEYFDVSNHSLYGKENGTTYKVLYDLNKVKEDLKTLNNELSTLQMSIDMTNLTSFIEL